MQVVISDKAKKQLKKLDKTALLLIKKYLIKIQQSENPASLGKPLKGTLQYYIRYRIGNYRIITFIDNDKLVITVLEVGHRKEIY